MKPRAEFLKAREDQILAIQCSKLSQAGLSQQDIAGVLNIAQSKVSLTLRDAHKAGWYFPNPTFVEAEVKDRDIIAEADRRLAVDQELQAQLDSWAPFGHKVKCFVMPTQDWDEFFTMAASTVMAELATANVVGVMWGAALKALIGKMSSLCMREPGWKTNIKSVIPVSGDPLATLCLGELDKTASSLAGQLDRLATGQTRDDLPSLTGLPAYIPTAFSKDPAKMAVLEEFFDTIPGYVAIFDRQKTQKEPPLVTSADALLTGIGIVPAEETDVQRVGTFISERYKRERRVIEPEQLAELIYGDFCGLLLKRENLDDKESELIDDLNRGWTGIREEEIIRVVRRGRDGKAPGVIMTAFSADRGAAIQQIVRLGLCNKIVVDVSAATAMKALPSGRGSGLTFPVRPVTAPVQSSVKERALVEASAVTGVKKPAPSRPRGKKPLRGASLRRPR